jgi:hypothetical protein
MNVPDWSHGTQRGYDRHRRHGEVACVECKAANAEYQREWKKRRLQTEARNLATEISPIADPLIRGLFDRLPPHPNYNQADWLRLAEAITGYLFNDACESAFNDTETP